MRDLQSVQAQSGITAAACAREAVGDILKVSLLFYVTQENACCSLQQHAGQQSLQQPCSAAEGNACHLGKQIAMIDESAVAVVDSNQAANLCRHESMCRPSKLLESSHGSNLERRRKVGTSGYLRVPACCKTGCAAFCCGACPGRMEWWFLVWVLLGFMLGLKLNTRKKGWSNIAAYASA